MHQIASKAERLGRFAVIALAAIFTGTLLYAREFVLAGAVVASWVAAAAAVPSLRRWLERRGAVAVPGGRRAHGGLVPLVGGVSVILPIAVALAIEGFRGGHWAFWTLGGCLLVFALGLRDDLRGVRARTKLVVQAGAAMLLVCGGMDLQWIGLPEVGDFIWSAGNWSIALTVAWVLLVTNAMNIVDGMDGVASLAALLALGGLVVLGQDLAVVAPFAAAVLGFLFWNLPPARAYLGDAGSLVLGFLIAALTLRLPAGANLPLAIGLLAFPLFDVALAVIRRLMRGSPLFQGDRSHVHHKLLSLVGERPLVVLLLVGLMGAVPLALAIGRPGLRSLVVSGLFGMAVAILIARWARSDFRTMVKDRSRHQRIYLVHGYVQSMLRLARTRADCARALQRLVDDMPLQSVEVAGLRVEATPGFGAAAGLEAATASQRLVVVDEHVPMKAGSGKWTHAFDASEPYSLRVARQSILCELLREAKQRVEELDPLPARRVRRIRRLRRVRGEAATVRSA